MDVAIAWIVAGVVLLAVALHHFAFSRYVAAGSGRRCGPAASVVSTW